MESSTNSRRGMLRAAVGLVAGAAGLGVAGSAAAGRRSPGERTIKLSVTELAAKAHGRGRGQLARPDDQVTMHGVIAPGSHGGGAFTAVATVINAPHVAGQSTVEQHLFMLDGGQLTGMGHLVQEQGLFVITGGTGAFAGARGHSVARSSPSGLGGDGTAHFTFTLTNEGTPWH